MARGADEVRETREATPDVRAPFARMVVFGPGLLGGSLLKAARARGVARECVAVARSEQSARAVAEAGLADAAFCEPAPALRGADLLLLCTPPQAMGETLRAASKHIEAGCIVSDVGSVKGALAETLPGLLPAHAHYVGAHPLAGGHVAGFAHARANLFEGATCVVNAAPQTRDAAARHAHARVVHFWRALGARVLLRAPEAHDAEVAWTSHAPHAIAYAFAAALAHAPAAARELRGAGFRDFTRIAASEPALWADILVANRKAAAAPLARTARALKGITRALEAGDAEALQALLTRGREALAQITQSGETPPRTREPEPDKESFRP